MIIVCAAPNTISCSDYYVLENDDFHKNFSSQELEESILRKNSVLSSENGMLCSQSRKKFLATPTLHGDTSRMKHILQ